MALLAKSIRMALHLWEGDTPTFFYLMPTGLNDPEQQWQGSWGGRFSREKMKNVNIVVQEYAGAPCSKGGCWVNEEPYLDYWMYSDATDQWTFQDQTYENIWAPIFRWRTDFQHDFAARMDWCVNDFEKANHNPVAVLNGDQTKQVLYRKLPQERVLSWMRQLLPILMEMSWYTTGGSIRKQAPMREKSLYRMLLPASPAFISLLMQREKPSILY